MPEKKPYVVMKPFLLGCATAVLCAYSFALLAQTRPRVNAPLLSTHPHLDGHLLDSCWAEAAVLEPFTTSTPVFGQTPLARTEVRLFFGEYALYVGAFCHSSGTVRDDYGIRDVELTGDWFRLSLDTWDDDRLAFNFTVSAAGVQLDARNAGVGWDALWQSAVVRHAEGWSVEMRIPYTALRFARQGRRHWGLQCTHFDRTAGELSTWSPQDPLVRDVVWQFGTLEGVPAVQQLRRASMAIQAEGTAREYRPFLRGGVDGRAGLGSASTLDVTLFPGYQVETGPLVIPFGSTADIGLSQTPRPRQFEEEERDLFEHNPHFTHYPLVDASAFSHRLPPNGLPVPVIIPRIASKSQVLQASKLTTRTRGNWRLGAYHALLEPVRRRIFFMGGADVENITLQGLSSYQSVAAEYILPNNGFVNASTAMLLASRDYQVYAPDVHWRVRNRANSLEVSGFANGRYDIRRDTSFSHGQYGLRLARINRRWGWAVSHSSKQLVRNDFLPEQSVRFETSNAEVLFQDYTPRGRWLNRFATAGLSRQIGGTYYSYVRLSGLDNGFRHWGLHLGCIPHYQRYRHTSGGVYLPQILAPEFDGRLSLTSDVRQRFIADIEASGRTTLRGENPSLGAAASLSWNLQQAWRLRANASAQRDFDHLTIQPIPLPSWFFLRQDLEYLTSRLTIEWFAGTHWQVWGTANYYRYRSFRAQIVELQDNGKFQPTDLPVEQSLTPHDVGWGGELGIRYVFWGISTLQLAYRYYWQLDRRGVFTPDEVSAGSLNLKAILFLDLLPR